MYLSKSQPLCFIRNALHCDPMSITRRMSKQQVYTCLHIKCIASLASVGRPNEFRDIKLQVVESDFSHGVGDKYEKKEQAMVRNEIEGSHAGIALSALCNYDG